MRLKLTAPRWPLPVLAVLGFVLYSSAAEGAILTAASCNRADVESAVNGAVAGDTVRIPAGSCVWTSQLDISKGITLQGAGQGVTVISDNVTKPGRLLVFNVAEPQRFRLTALSIVGQAPDTQIYNQGHIFITGTTKAFRIDHITVVDNKTAFIRTDGYLLGVIDHVTLTGNKPFLVASHANWGGSAYGDGSWAEPLYWGTEKAIYVEDSTITASGNPYTSNAFDAYDGARVVIRYNAFTQANISSHGSDSSQRRRSVRSMEVYNNTFNFPYNMAVDFIVWVRGGTGTVFNNTINHQNTYLGLNSMAKGTNCRDADAGCGGPSFPPWGACNGTSAYDLNLPGQTGYRCVDQPGSGTSRHLDALPLPTAVPVQNSSDPFYVWGNTKDGQPFDVVMATVHVQRDRDYLNNGTRRPGYTPYAYPHPLSTGNYTPPAPAAPTSLRIFR